MAWSTPRTWVAGETLTASNMNTHLRDNLNAVAERNPIIEIGDVAGAVLTTGIKGYKFISFPFTVSGWTIVGDVGGSIVVDIWRATYPTVPTVANTVAGTEKPTLSSQQVNQDSSLSSWSTSFAANSLIGVKVDSVSSLRHVAITLHTAQA
jgi:hypothetical protein